MRNLGQAFGIHLKLPGWVLSKFYFFEFNTLKLLMAEYCEISRSCLEVWEVNRNNLLKINIY
jgi:hypothetical protein